MNNKKLTALLASFAVLGTMVTAVPAMAQKVELVPNGSMETHATEGENELVSSWVTTGSAKNRSYHDGSAEAIGTNSTGILKCTDRWNDASAPRAFLTQDLTANTTYAVTADVYVPGETVTTETHTIRVYVAALYTCDQQGVDGSAHIWGHPEYVYGEKTVQLTSENINTWQTITFDFIPATVYSAENLPTTDIIDGETLTYKGVIVEVQVLGTSTSTDVFYVDNVSVAYEDGTTESNYVAKVDNNYYKSLDDAIDAAEGAEITLLADADIVKTHDGKKAVINGTDKTKTITVNTSDAAMISNLTLKNVTITGTTNGKLLAGADLTLDNATIKNFTDFDCLNLGSFTASNGSSIEDCQANVSCIPNNWGTITIDGLSVSGTTTGWGTPIRLNDNYETITHTIANSTITSSETAVTVESANVKAVITDSTISSVNNKGQLKLTGATNVTKLSNSGVLTLASDFAGSVEVHVDDPAVGTEIATVETGADFSNVTVENMDAANELKVTEDGKLMIAAKATPSANLSDATFTANLDGYTASGNTLKDAAGNTVYGYAATLTGNGTAYTTVKAYAKSSDGSKEETKTYTGGIVGGTGDCVFYIIANKTLDTTASKVYCE